MPYLFTSDKGSLSASVSNLTMGIATWATIAYGCDIIPESAPPLESGSPIRINDYLSAEIAKVIEEAAEALKNTGSATSTELRTLASVMAVGGGALTKK